MSASAIRFAHRALTKSIGHVSTAALGLTESDLTPEVSDPLAPTLALSKPDCFGRMPVAWAAGGYVYDECNLQSVETTKLRRGKIVTIQRWIVS